VLATAPGDLDGVAYLQKYTTLEHMQADQVAKLQSDIIYRRLVEVSTPMCLGKRLSHFFTACTAAAWSIFTTGSTSVWLRLISLVPSMFMPRSP
jgi:hypothetical protein